MPVGIFSKFCTIPTSWFHVWMAQDRDFLEVFAGRGAVTAAPRAVAWRISICIRDQKFLCRLTFSALDCKISNASLSNKCIYFVFSEADLRGAAIDLEYNPRAFDLTNSAAFASLDWYIGGISPASS